MRGDVALSARLLLRPVGIGGLLVFASGALALWGAASPLATTTATVSMLGASDAALVDTVRGLPATPEGWLAALTGLAAVVVGLLLALDRRPPRTVALVSAAAVTWVLAAAAGTARALKIPPEVAADPVAALGAPATLPVGVEVELAGTVGPGAWLLVLASATAGAGLVLARDR